MFGTIKAIQGREVTIQLEDELNPEFLELLAHGDQNHIDMKLLDNRGITAKQNRLSHALIKDIAEWSGDVPIYTEQYLKYDYMAISGTWFFHRKGTRADAREWINFLIEFVLKNDVALPKVYEYLKDDNAWFYYCLKYRRCCICGKPADVAHVEEVGMGRNRHEIDHSQHHFMALCREHHSEQHTIGRDIFIEIYQILPVYLDYQTRKKLGVGG